MFELLSIVCTAAALMQGGCIPEGVLHGEAKMIVPDTFEEMIAPKTFHLSYSGSGHDFNPASLTAHWRRRAAQLCAGDYSGHPVSQTQYPEPGYEAMISMTFLSAQRTFNVETYGVAYCTS